MFSEIIKKKDSSLVKRMVYNFGAILKKMKKNARCKPYLKKQYIAF